MTLPYFQVHVFTRAPKGEQSDPDLVNECNNMCNAFTWYFSRKNIIK
jgi:hypothetical protein